MPKIIADIENRILSAAEKLFSTQGYQETDMRQIAEQAGIAVGSIYKYHEDKHQLYLQVLSTSWLETIQELESIAAEDRPPAELLTEMIARLSEKISSRQIWREISVMFTQNQAQTGKNSQFKGMHLKFSEVFSGVIARMLTPGDRSRQLADQLGSFAFVMTADLSHLPSAQAVAQSKLIADLLLNYLAKTSPEDTT